MIEYKLGKSVDGNDYIIKKESNNKIWSIPIIQDNTDYQEYLKWLAEGNTPLPADE